MNKKQPQFAKHVGVQRYARVDPWPNAQWVQREPLPTVGEVATYVAGAITLAVFCFGVLGLA